MPSKKPETLETLKIAIELLRRIPRHSKVSSSELLQQLRAIGYERDSRSIQRLLKTLSEHFDIECDDSSLPYGYRWKEQGSGLMMPTLNRQESLLLMLAEKHLVQLLPPNVMKAMAGFFHQARSNLAPHQDATLERQWLRKVRVVSETQPLLPPKLVGSVLEVVASGLYFNHWLDVDYTNQRDERKKNRIMPLGLVQQGPRLYLVCRFEGYDNQRILAMHRINSVSDSGLTFELPNFDLTAYEEDGQLAMGNGERIRLEFEISKLAGRHILESPLSKDQTVTELAESYVITATVVESLQLNRWLHSFGSQIWSVKKLNV